MLARGIARTGLAAGALAGLAACSSVLAPVLKPDVSTRVIEIEGGDWRLDPSHAALTFEIDHLGYSTFLGRFEQFDVRINGSPENLAGLEVEATVDMNSLDVADDAFATTLMGPDWFNAGRFPEARFQSTRILQTSPVTAEVEGILTLHGKNRPLVLSVVFNGSGYDRLRGADVAGFSVTATLDRSDFGIDRFSGLLAEEVHIRIEAELLKTDGVT